jgi:hypothetical protein
VFNAALAWLVVSALLAIVCLMLGYPDADGRVGAVAQTGDDLSRSAPKGSRCASRSTPTGTVAGSRLCQKWDGRPHRRSARRQPD